MLARRFAIVILAASAMTAATPARSEVLSGSITFNLIEKPTNNKNIFGTTFSSGTVTNWGNNYMKYQLMLSSSTSYEFTSMYTQVFANKGNQNTNPGNALRVAMFDVDPTVSGSFVSDSNALFRTNLNQAAVSPTFTQYLIGPATEGAFPYIIVGPDPLVYYLMLYAEGSVANQGYGLKIDSVLRDVQFYAPDDPDLEVQYANSSGTYFTADNNFVPVPEPNVPLSAAAASGAIACLALRRSLRFRRCRGRESDQSLGLPGPACG